MTHQGRKFKLVRLLGVGGFGEVYLADMSTPSGFTKTVALKLLREAVDSTDDVAARMRDEARMLGLLRHRSIVQADDLISIDGRVSVVMEFIPGCNLSSLLSYSCYEHDIPLRVVVHVLAEMADALVAAYSRPSTVTGEPLRVLHRDIKPANVRITPDGEVKILDFGIARAEQMERAAETKEIALGTLHYMAPELLAGIGASLASDIYALGITFVESMIRERFGLAGDNREEHTEKINRKLEDVDFSGNEEHRATVGKLVHQMLAFEAAERAGGEQVVNIAQELVGELSGPTMVQWAREAVPMVAESASASGADVDLSGTDLLEDMMPSADQGPHADALFEDPTLAMSNASEALLAGAEQTGAKRPILWLGLGALLLAGLAATYFGPAPAPAPQVQVQTPEELARSAAERAVAEATERFEAKLEAERAAAVAEAEAAA